MLRFSKSHLWVDLGPDGLAVTGITNYGAKTLGFISNIHLSSAGQDLSRNDTLAEVYGSNPPHNAPMLLQLGQGPIGGKWRHVLNAPLQCRLVECHALVSAKTLNEDPEGAGWLARIRVVNALEVESLLDREAYDGFCETIDNLKVPLPTGWINE